MFFGGVCPSWQAELGIAGRGRYCSDHVNDLTGKQPGRAERRQAEERWQPRQWLSFREHSLFLEQTGMPLSISYIQLVNIIHTVWH